MNTNEKVSSTDKVSCGLVANNSVSDDLQAPFITFDVTCLDANGNEKWREVSRNTVMTAGKTDIVDKYLKGSAYTAAFYLGLKNTGSIAVGDTLASHAGYTEATPYAGNRPAITWGTTSAGSNTASAVSISINATDTDVAGAFVCTVNSGTSGTLYCCSNFSVTRSVASGDTLNVTPTITVA